jgi:two-component system cell cycle response regulator DivK
MRTNTILVVEQNDQFRMAIRKSLQRCGYRVLESGTSAAAMTLATTHRPNLILMDPDLPDGDGLEVAQRLRRCADTSRIPIVVLSGKPALGQRAGIVAAICAGSIPKSVALERLEGDLKLLLSMARAYAPRRFPRYTVEIPAFYRRRMEADSGKEEAGAGMVRTLSEGGARFDLPNPVPAATILDLRLQVPGGEVSAAGRVVYSRYRADKQAEKSWYMHGVQFMDLDPKTFERLKPLMTMKAATTG